MLNNSDAIVAALLFLMGRKKPKAESPLTAAADAGALVARANQQGAAKWAAIFESVGLSAPEARALARWAGIESSGNALAVSKSGERGLLQITRTTALVENAISQTDWDKLGSPKTSSEDHARIGAKMVAWLYKRAAKHVKGSPIPDSDTVGKIWLAKLYHQRPVDVRDAGLTGPDPKAMARYLADKWKADPKKMHYLRAANVVAWGQPEA